MDESAGLQNDDDLLAYLKSEIQTVYHPSGTCRMGSDDGAPVDPVLRMRGIANLWVCDASVMPTVPRGHPNAVVAMIARRAAEWIGRDGNLAAGAVAATARAENPLPVSG